MNRMDIKTKDMLSRVRNAKHIQNKSEKEAFMKRIRKICAINDITQKYLIRFDLQKS